MLQDHLRRAAAAVAVAAMALSGAGGTFAQPAGPDNNPPPPPARYNVPPPDGYQPGDDQTENSAQAREEDQRYSYEAERWAERNCVAQRANNAATGAVIGGVLGAILGSSLSGRYDRAGGAFAGGAAGAVVGGAIGGSSASNPDCPRGYVLRPGGEPFYPGPVYGDVIYMAPAWYDPWIWYGNHWIYRPYPYHRYWYRTHRR